MFEIYFEKTSAVFCIYFILLCAVLSNGVSRLELEKDLNKKYDQYAKPLSFEFPPDWGLSPFGKSASEFLRLFFKFSTAGAIKTTLHSDYKDEPSFVKNILVYTFTQQVFMTFTVCLSLLVACLLLLWPCFIVLYRNRKHTALEEKQMDRTVISKKGYILYAVLIIFLVITVFGAIIMCLSLKKFGDEIPESFNFAISSVNTSYHIKGAILNHFYYFLYDVSRSSFDTIQSFYDVNDNVGTEFMTYIDYRFEPVLYLARSVQWDLTGVHGVLKYNEEQLESSKNYTDFFIRELGDEYVASLDALKKVFEDDKAINIFGSVLEPLFKIPSYEPSNSTIESFRKSIDRLEAALKLDLHLKLQNMRSNIYDSTSYPIYDPSEITKKLKETIFATELKIRNSVGSYINMLESSFSEIKRADAVKDIEAIKVRLIRGFKYSYFIILIFGILAALLGIFSILTYSFGVIGTKGFRIRPSGIYHASGKVMLVFIYFAAVFLALFSMTSLLIFVASVVPLELCILSQDKSICDVTIDYFSFQPPERWYSMYSTPKFNSTMKDTLQNCEADASFSFVLRDPLVDDTPFKELKATLDTSSVKTIDNVIGDLPYPNMSDSDLSTLNLTGVLNIDTHSFFQELLDFRRALSETNASAVFSEIKDHERSSENLKNAAEAAIESYDNFIVSLSKAVANKNGIDVSLRSLNISLQILMTQVDHLVFSYGDFVDFIQKQGSDIYMSNLNSAVLKTIDETQRNLNLSTLEFRRLISYCPVLTSFYKRYLHLICKQILYPVAACWFGSFLVDIFLFLAVCVALYLSLCLVPPKTNSLELPPAIICAGDIPIE